jgi:UDP-N-acetylmuramate--L-alanine ligase/undecaprenyldiphospho-muramoylpentapeptide beta-N-acetylglucosaminyltransferase
MPTIVIAAGGTAGHVVPALAIADELRADGADVHFVAGDRIEAELVPAAGYELSRISASGLDRRNPLRAAGAAVRAPGAVGRSARILRALRPDAVVGGGGYVAGPVGLAAVLLRIPLVLTEADSRLGLANRLLAPFARRVCLSFPIAGREGDRYVVTGRPVPAAIAATDRASARERLGVDPATPCLLVFGGSLGALSLNESAIEAFAEQPPLVAGRPGSVLHVAGRRDYEHIAARLAAAGDPSHYTLFEYLPTMADPLAAADLVVARAGGSVFELLAAGRPAVLVPYPHASGDHQSANARWMADAGAAVVVPDADLDPERLRTVAEQLLGDGERLTRMSSAAHALARPDAARRVAEEVLATATAPAEEPAAARPDRAEAPWSGRRLHFVGIGGAGMSGLALVAHALGAEVTGCDRAASAYTEMLANAGIEPELGHSPEHVRDERELVVSTAVPGDEPELEAARGAGVPILHRGRLLAQIAAERRLIAVTGTHGKTTTAAMVAHVMAACDLDPSFLIGAELRAGDARNAHLGAGDWLVAEADESDRSFLELSPQVAVVTNLELDHHATYSSLSEVEDAFRSFLARLDDSGSAVVWDLPELVRLVPEGRELHTYGIGDGAGLRARELSQAGERTTFELVRDGQTVTKVELPVPGRHNVLNALAALAACELAGCELVRAARSLVSFRAAGRRFELRGEGGGVRVYDDYAHHPTEVEATLTAARALEPRRLIAVFQPHLYSRTLHLYRELGRALAGADVTVVLDVYPAREQAQGELAGVTGKLVADATADAAGGKPVWWLPTLEEAEAVVSGMLEEGDVLVTLGAGDVDQVADRVASRLNGSA